MIRKIRRGEFRISVFTRFCIRVKPWGMDLIQDCIGKRVKTLEECVTILPILTQEKKNNPIVYEISHRMNLMIEDLKTIKDQLSQVKKENEALKMTIQKVNDTNTYMDYMESNLPALALVHGAQTKGAPYITGEVSGHPNSGTTATKHTIKLRYLEYLSAKEFEDIPYYLRGRLSVAELNCFINSFNKALELKYSILNSEKGKLKLLDRPTYELLRKQMIREAPGLVFCTEDDLKKCANVKSGHSLKGLLSILRHAQQIKEVRFDGWVRFAVFQSAQQYEKQLKELNAI